MERINNWHANLFPFGYSGYGKITTGNLCNRDVSVVSGYIGKEKIHFEAPPAKQAIEELKIFIDWFNNSFEKEDGLLRAASCHLKFVTIHPYDDGNGRLSRVITDMAMAQDEKNGTHFYSLSSQIMEERKRYYQILEDTQTLKCDLTQWYEWFINMFINALKNSEKIFQSAFFQAVFWNRIKDIVLNERQKKVIKKLLDIDNFEGGLTTRKYVHLTKVSNATAFREMADMQVKGILKQYGAGRNVRYELNKKITG
jgi:Fic family protein